MAAIHLPTPIRDRLLPGQRGAINDEYTLAAYRIVADREHDQLHRPGEPVVRGAAFYAVAQYWSGRDGHCFVGFLVDIFSAAGAVRHGAGPVGRPLCVRR